MKDTGEFDWQAWGLGIIAWLIPGAGHLLQGKWLRGLILGGVVWALFIVGKAWGGHFYPLFGNTDPTATYLDTFWSLMNLGTGAVYLFSLAANANLNGKLALDTYEYGVTFLKVAGLVNFLVMLDAFDIKVGRKS
jgi:hypothetical protein